MAVELVVIGPTTGAAYTYARGRFGDQAPDRCFVPVAPFSLSMFAHERRTGQMPSVVVLPGSEARDDWSSWESVLKTVKPMSIAFLEK